MVTKEKFDPKRLEEGHELLLDFNKLKKVAQSREAVVAVAVQDVDSKEVLLVAYANEAALKYTLTNGIAAFWSTSREELWVKGATSGDTLEIVEVRVNCEQNSLLYLVRPLGEGVCHTKGPDGKSRKRCYYRRISNGQLEFVDEKGRKP
jgi:phosphoribosyl-AMP cyclohydrolase